MSVIGHGVATDEAHSFCFYLLTSRKIDILAEMYVVDLSHFGHLYHFFPNHSIWKTMY